MAINAVLALLVWWAVAKPARSPFAYLAALLLLVLLYGFAGRLRPPAIEPSRL